MASAATTATASYSTLSPKHNINNHHNLTNKNVLGFVSKNRIRICPLSISISSSRTVKQIPMKISATSAVIETSKSSLPTVVDVNLGDRSYPIYIGSGLLNQPDLLQRYYYYNNYYCSFSFISLGL